MKNKMNLDPTVVFAGKVVSHLPDEIQNEIKTLDRMRQDYVNIQYQAEVLQLAITTKAAVLQNQLTAQDTALNNTSDSDGSNDDTQNT